VPYNAGARPDRGWHAFSDFSWRLRPNARRMTDSPTSGANLTVAVAVDRAAFRGRVLASLETAGIDCPIVLDSLGPLSPEAVNGGVDATVLRSGTTRMQAFETFAAARTAFAVPIVGIWPEDERREHRRALRTGIDALLLDSQIETALVAVVRAVCLGLACLPRVAPGFAIETLSNREKQVLGMLIMGFTNAEIAQRLYVAESTVKSHLSSAYVKIGVRSRKDAAALILDPDEGLGTAILAISPSRAGGSRDREPSATGADPS
jgi:DNA-binding NarL/FixJ family response regulator